MVSHFSTGSYFARVGTHKNQDSRTDSGRGLPAPESLGKMEFSVPRATHVEAQRRVNYAGKLPQAIV